MTRDFGGITPSLLVHGGAGRWIGAEHEVAQQGCGQAVVAGLSAFGAGADALEVVICAVRVLEDNPLFNAGIGSVLTRAGDIEVDAAVMEGTTLRFGGIAAVPNGYPGIELARAILDDGEHALMCGQAVWDMLSERGFQPPAAEALRTPRAIERLAQEAERRRGIAGGPGDPGTVGAVAVDARGRVAAATSTGGMTYKRAGRIGDTPLAGCGTYADDRGGAASATGHGEAIIRVTMARLCTDRMRGGATAAEAAWAAIDALEDVGGLAGVICCDARGGLGAAHNTGAMAWAGGRVGEPIRTAMCMERDGSVFALP